MKALAIIAHGSRAVAANEEFQALAGRVAEQLGDKYELTMPCFLELAEPSIEQACEHLAAQGADSIDVYPLFFNKGKHVAVDIPKHVAHAKANLPNTPIRVFRYFGAGDDLANWVANDIAGEPCGE